MAWDTLTMIVAGLEALDYRGRIHPYGNGEPLTDPDFLDRVQFIRTYLPECFMFMATNGDYINHPWTFEDLHQAGLHEIQVNHYDEKNRHLKDRSPAYVVHCDIGMLRTTFYNRAGNIKFTNITPSGTCWFPGRKLYFNYQGDMLVCCSDWTFADPIGNIHRQSLEELLDSPKLRNYQEKLAQGKASELPLCSQCNLLRHQEVNRNNGG